MRQNSEIRGLDTAGCQVSVGTANKRSEELAVDPKNSNSSDGKWHEVHAGGALDIQVRVAQQEETIFHVQLMPTRPEPEEETEVDVH